MSKEILKISADVKDNKAVIRIDGTISQWNNYSASFKAKLDDIISQGITDATVYINSPGGSCFEANEIVNEITRFKGTITAVLGALCASAATYIACKCTTVIAAKNNNYMIHKPWTYIEGNSDEIKANLKLLENLQKDYANAYAAKTGLSVKEIETMWVQDYWMNSEEAKAKGFINEIEGEAEITDQDVSAIRAYKNAPKITATAVIPQDTTKTDKMKEKLIMALALSATATDVEVIAHVDALKAKAAKADALQTQLNSLVAATQKEKVDTVLAKAQADKKFTAAQQGFWEKQLYADFDGTKAVIDSMPAAVKLSEQTHGNAKNTDNSDRANWTYADYMEKDPTALETMAKNDAPAFTALAKAYYGDNF